MLGKHFDIKWKLPTGLHYWSDTANHLFQQDAQIQSNLRKKLKVATGAAGETTFNWNLGCLCVNYQLNYKSPQLRLHRPLIVAFSYYRIELLPLTSTSELDRDSVKANQHAKCHLVVQKLLSRHTDTHTWPFALPGPLKCGINKFQFLSLMGDGGWWRWVLVGPDGVVPSWMVGVSVSVNLPLHHKVQNFSSGNGSPGWSRKKGRKTVVCVCV